jgi:glutamine synthetase
MADQRLRGMLTIEQLQQQVEAGEVETVLVVFTDLYGRLMGKRVSADFFLDQVADGGRRACDYLLTVDTEMEPIPGYRFANWELGYGDFHCTPDLSTLRMATWLDKWALVLRNVDQIKTYAPVSVALRSILNLNIVYANVLTMADD